MKCNNPNCKGTPEFEFTDQEKRLLAEFNVDGQEDIYYCRQCREMRRTAVRNERNFFKRKCDQSDKEIWTTYPKNSPFKVFDKDIWWGDAWDGLTYGRNFNFERTFFQQFYEMMLEVPRPSAIQQKNQNSDFTNDANSNNDCYMIFTSDDNVNCHYGSFINCKDSMDCEEVYQCELCYDSLYCKECHAAIASEYCVNCSNIYFSSNLVNCHNCIFCFGLRDARNCIFNTEVSPDVFMTFILQRQLFRRRSYQKAKEMFHMFLETAPQRYMYLLKTDDSTGDRLIACKDCENTYSAENSVACSNIASSCIEVKDCLDCWAIAYGTEKSYENQTCLRGGFNFVGNFSNDCSNCYYIDNCQNCQNCFGCIGLKNKKNCVFNKQYSKEEYEELKNKLIEHMKKTKEWGQFFPFWMSPYPYNTTIAHLYYPLKLAEFSTLLKISEEKFPPPPKYKKEHLWLIDKITHPSRKKREEKEALFPPDSLFEAKNDEILKTIYHDIDTKKPFRIMGRELALYQKIKVPLPEKLFKSRYEERLGRYNKRLLHKRKCQKCGVEIETTFAPESPYIVFCSDCFQKSLQ